MLNPCQLVEPEGSKIDWELAKQLYDNLVDKHLSNSEAPAPPFSSIIAGEDGLGKTRVERAAQYADRLGLAKVEEGIGHAFLNGRYMPLDAVCRLPFCLLRDVHTTSSLAYFLKYSI
jgi:hypothetical protein